MCGLRADGWQDALRRELEGTTIHFIDDVWSKPHAVLVDLHQIPAKHRDTRTKAKYYQELFNMYVFADLHFVRTYPLRCLEVNSKTCVLTVTTGT
jgi:hypothetical protein